MEPQLQGYIDELRAQNTGLSDRAGHLAAALAVEKHEHAETIKKLRDLEESAASAQK